ncbi:hypothetical protein GUJ93_ZPchr0013g34278 [Zizania palustris]|uniref:Reverse transcriptase zinc-binding domain-containing protein n=1 Tax=Zizania palustris TaxID=103762 RepID=A0A8J6BZR3_ZIZPA|nr:hypothetical protein GUJ93_ZPchr0013g34278 [Zizania palustris]
MNCALLGKWVFNTLSGKQGLCYDLMRRKYNLREHALGMNHSKGSCFWNNIQNVKSLVMGNCKFEVGRGDSIRFWEDAWLDDLPLKIKCFGLYKVCSVQGVSVCSVKQDGWFCLFRRSLNSFEILQWEDVVGKCLEVSMNEEGDKVVWMLNRNGFSSKSLYHWLVFGGIVDDRCRLVWRVAAPLKVKIFLWLVMHGKIQAGEQLKNRGWRGDPYCKWCGEMESVNHLMFQCSLSRLLWCFVRDAMGWQRSLTDYRQIGGIQLGYMSAKKKTCVLGNGGSGGVDDLGYS